MTTIHYQTDRRAHTTFCCGVPISDIPHTERVSSDPGKVTCKEFKLPQPEQKVDWEATLRDRMIELRRDGHATFNPEYEQISDLLLRVDASREAEKQDSQPLRAESRRMVASLQVQLSQAHTQVDEARAMAERWATAHQKAEENSRILRDRLNDALGVMAEANESRNGAYMERAKVLRMALAVDLTRIFHSVVMTPATDVQEPGWWIIFLHSESGQMSWHLSPEQAELFDFVERVKPTDPRAVWDNHTTEQKYQRIDDLVAFLTKQL